MEKTWDDIHKLNISRMASLAVLVKARQILNSKQVILTDLLDNCARGKISDDGKTCVVDCKIDSNGELRCTCTCNSKEAGNCEHSTALLFQVKGTYTKKPQLNFFEQFLERKKDPQEFIHIFDFTGMSQIPPRYALKKARIRKDGSVGIIQQMTPEELSELNFIDAKSCFKVAELFLQESTQLEKRVHDDYLSDNILTSLHALYKQHPQAFRGAVFLDEPASLALKVKKTGDSYILKTYAQCKEKAYELQDVLFLGKNILYCFFTQEKMFAKIQTKDANKARRLLLLTKQKISKAQLEEFVQKYFLPLSAHAHIELPSEIVIQQKKSVPQPCLFLDSEGKNLVLEFKLKYDQTLVDYFGSERIIIKENNQFWSIERDKEQEKKYLDILLHHNVMLFHGELQVEMSAHEWILSELVKLATQGFAIYGEEKLLNFKLNKQNPVFAISVKKSSNWFDIQGEAEFGEKKVALKEIIQAIAKGERYVAISGDEKAIIPEKWFATLQGLANYFKVFDKDLKASLGHVSLVAELAKLCDKAEVDTQVVKLHEQLKNVESIPGYDLPEGIQATLRDYQKSGYDWLRFLHEQGMNGCLADDMGLGKTLQTLSLLKKVLTDAQNPALIVVPTTLVFNWVQEIKKFTPDLPCRVYHGLGRHRIEWGPGIIVTTYGTLRNDIDTLKDIHFNYVILDESQAIKNPFSGTARATYQLKAEHKLILTGTPIQNNLLDLWSQFHFLNPGFLGNYEFFKSSFITSQDKSATKTETLRGMIHPLILRRTKETVSAELPSKTETNLLCSMSPDQQQVYDHWKEFYRKTITNALEEKGLAKSKFIVLEGLTKLRQICNHPRLINPDYTGESAKFTLLLENLRSVIEEGHKVLVFSSFVKMLQEIRHTLETDKINYCYLDGSTKNREEVINEFNNSDCKVFLISIKAGGVGINLTTADYVFIVDPWWNPAVERQAIDRTHRIGQKKKVFVYKLITTESIEEKIVALQESKKKLVKEVIVDEESFMKVIDPEMVRQLFR